MKQSVRPKNEEDPRRTTIQEAQEEESVPSKTARRTRRPLKEGIGSMPIHRRQEEPVTVTDTKKTTKNRSYEERDQEPIKQRRRPTKIQEPMIDTRTND